MEYELITAILAGLGGMLGWGLADLFAKKTIDEIGDISSLAWGHLFGSIAFLIFTFYRVSYGSSPVEMPNTASQWLLLSTFGVFQGTIYLFVYKGFGKGQVAILNPVFASFTGLTALLSIFIFKEIVSGYVLAGLVVLFTGILLLSVDFTAWKSRREGWARIPGLREVGLATVMAAFWTLFWDKFLGGQDWLAYATIMYVSMTIFIFLVAWYQKAKLSGVGQGMWKYLVLIGACEAVAYLAISQGYSATGYTSVIALLSGAFSLPTIILARVFLKERITLTQTIGGFVVIAGIMVISIT
jgi:uncharacterized membrane protein